MHQWSVLSPLMFALVSSEEIRGIYYELLYTDDLVLVGPIMEPLGTPVAEWRVSLLAGKSKVMVVSSNLLKILESGPVATVGKEYRQTLCTVCKKWCSGCSC